MSLRFRTLAAVCLLVSTMGCESRFVESSPDAVKVKGLTLEQRQAEKEKVDSHMEEIQASAERIKRIITLFQKIQSPSTSGDAYTPVDFLIDLNNELKNELPQPGKDGNLFRQVGLEIPIATLTEDCRHVDAMLLQTDISGDESGTVGERLTYSLKTCGSDQYVEAITADWTESGINFKILNKNISAIFKNLMLGDLNQESACSVTTTDDNILESIHCQNLQVKLSVSEKAIVKDMVFSNHGDERFSAKADVYENDVLKANADLEVGADGKTSFQTQKVATASAVADTASAADATTAQK